MTLADLDALDQEFLTPAQVAPLLGCQPYSINVQARDSPHRLGFPVCVLGSRVKIPRIAFIRWMRGELGKEETACEEMIQPGS